VTLFLCSTTNIFLFLRSTTNIFAHNIYFCTLIHKLWEYLPNRTAIHEFCCVDTHFEKSPWPMCPSRKPIPQPHAKSWPNHNTCKAQHFSLILPLTPAASPSPSSSPPHFHLVPSPQCFHQMISKPAGLASPLWLQSLYDADSRLVNGEDQRSSMGILAAVVRGFYVRAFVL